MNPMNAKRFHANKLNKLNDIIDALLECKDILAEISKAEAHQPGGDPEGLYNILVGVEELILDVEEELDIALDASALANVSPAVQAAPQA